MASINFIEVDNIEFCSHCNRKKLKQTDKFYKLFIGVRDMGIEVCELCKTGYLTYRIEGFDKTYSTHLIFYAKTKLSLMKENLSQEIVTELNCAISSYEQGQYSTSFRSISFVAEILTERLYSKHISQNKEKKDIRWETRLGQLLSQAQKTEKIPLEPIIYQLFSLKWLRNKVSHPSRYVLTGEDVRFGLISILYALSQTKLLNLI